MLEVLQFPAGKGDAKWHAPSDKLFLGIDHTAIVVADTDASLNFYRDALNMKIVGESENYGAEVERKVIHEAHEATRSKNPQESMKDMKPHEASNAKTQSASCCFVLFVDAFDGFTLETR